MLYLWRVQKVEDSVLFQIGFVGGVLLISVPPVFLCLQVIFLTSGFGMLYIGIGLFLHSVLFLGYWRRYDQVFGLVVFIVSNVLAIPPLFYVSLRLLYLIPPLLLPLEFLPLTLIGLSFLFWGVGLIVLGRRKSVGRLTLVAGVLFLIYGVILGLVVTYAGVVFHILLGMFFISILSVDFGAFTITLGGTAVILALIDLFKEGFPKMKGKPKRI